MKAAINICSDPKLLADSTNPVAIGIPNANLAKLCQGAASLPHYTMETIRVRAETVTPFLKEILDYSPPEHLEIIE